MQNYSEFKVMNCSVKVIFNNTGDFSIRPMTITSAYSDNIIIHPKIEYDKLNALDTVTHNGTDKTWYKAWNTSASLKKQGISWCSTSEWIDGKFLDPAFKLYAG